MRTRFTFTNNYKSFTEWQPKMDYRTFCAWTRFPEQGYEIIGKALEKYRYPKKNFWEENVKDRTFRSERECIVILSYCCNWD